MATLGVTSQTPLALDNDVFTDWRNGRPHILNLVQAYQERQKLPPALTAMTAFQARFGFEKERARLGALDERFERARVGMERMIEECGVLEINQQATAIAAFVFAHLSASERNRHWADVFIAAAAMAHGYGVATRNQRDFELIGQYLPSYAPVLFLAIWKS